MCLCAWSKFFFCVSFKVPIFEFKTDDAYMNDIGKISTVNESLRNCGKKMKEKPRLKSLHLTHYKQFNILFNKTILFLTFQSINWNRYRNSLKKYNWMETHIQNPSQVESLNIILIHYY